MERQVPVYTPGRKNPVAVRLADVPSLFSEGSEPDEPARQEPFWRLECGNAAAAAFADQARRSPAIKNPSVPLVSGDSRRPMPCGAAKRARSGSPAAATSASAPNGRKIRMAAEEGRDPLLVLRRQQRAGDVDEPPAGLHIMRRALQHLVLLFDALLAARRGGCAIWRRDCAARCPCRCKARRPGRGRSGLRDRQGHLARGAGCGPGRCAWPARSSRA